MSNEQKEPESNKPGTQSLGLWIAVAVAIRAGLGVAMDNLPVGVGVAMGVAQNQRIKSK